MVNRRPRDLDSISTLSTSDVIVAEDISESTSTDVRKTTVADIVALASGGPLTAKKTSDETVSSSTTLQNDDELFIALEANKTYAFEFFLLVLTNAAPDFKWAITGPSGATGRVLGDAVTGDTLFQTQALGTSVAATLFASSTGGLVLHGTITTSATPGNLQLQWAQNTSSAISTTVESGSYLIVHEL